MKYVSLSGADRIYEVTSGATIERQLVTNETLGRYADALRELIRAVGEDRSDDYWRTGLSPLKHCRFVLLATPLPSGHPDVGALSAVSAARAHFSDCGRVFPEHAELATTVCDRLSDLCLANTDDIGAAIANAASDFADERIGVVLPSFGFDRAVEHHLKAEYDLGLDVMNPRTLVEREPYDLQFVVGSPFWYSRRGWHWVFTAPRAAVVHSIAYGLAAGSLPPASAFSRSRLGRTHMRRMEAVVAPDAADDDEIEFGADLVSLPLASPGQGGQSSEIVSARVFLLGDGFAAFLSASPEARTETLSLEQPPGQRVVALPVDELIPGSFVLLRSEGGGDYVVAVADRLLGTQAQALRTMQVEWKSRLRHRVDQVGIDHIVRALRGHGSARADRQNVRNWCSQRTLRTQDQADFRAIMRLIGLEDEEADYWQAMGVLHRAHTRAGAAIRTRLEKEAELADFSELEVAGRIDFTLPQGGGVLTAFRIEDIGSDIANVPSSQLNVPFPVRA
jgi:hypothetical protein